jgi:hypothetical protein
MTNEMRHDVADPKEAGEVIISTAMKKKRRLGQSDSPPPAPGVIRDIPASEVPGGYVDAWTHIMFYGEEARRRMKNGENVILVPDPGVKITREEARRRLRKRNPYLAGVTRETMDIVREEWGR